MAVLLGLVSGACKEKKKPSLSGEEPVGVADFISAFELRKPPFEIADSSLLKKQNDSLLINNKIFRQFVPDSVLANVFGKNAKPKIYAGHRVEVEKQETYLFVNVVTSDKRAVLVLGFNSKNNFSSYLPLLVTDADAATTQVSGLDRRFSFYKNTLLKKKDGTQAEGKEVYSYISDPGQFILIMTDALDDRIKEVINPIDTLPRKNKLSADYVRDKMNIVSIRDGSRPEKIDFFIHFDKDNGGCTGELKGTATLTKNNTAIYRMQGDACSLQFNFTATSVSIKELEPCGSHRGVKCSFDGTYLRKKEVKKRTAVKRTSK
jgi:hypothetical protein